MSEKTNDTVASCSTAGYLQSIINEDDCYIPYNDLKFNDDDGDDESLESLLHGNKFPQMQPLSENSSVPLHPNIRERQPQLPDYGPDCGKYKRKALNKLQEIKYKGRINEIKNKIGPSMNATYDVEKILKIKKYTPEFLFNISEGIIDMERILIKSENELSLGQMRYLFSKDVLRKIKPDCYLYKELFCMFEGFTFERDEINCDVFNIKKEYDDVRPFYK